MPTLIKFSYVESCYLAAVECGHDLSLILGRVEPIIFTVYCILEDDCFRFL